MTALAGLALLACAGVVAGSSFGARSGSGFECAGSETVLFDNTNGFGVRSGGSPPSFSTKGKAYCVTYLEHYHWNGGKGAAPGRIGLQATSVSLDAKTLVGPYQALGSSGQGGARDVNHYVYVARDPPVVINGTYRCTDSAAATWSSNTQSSGQGFCIVKGVPALATGSSTPGTTTAATTTATGPAWQYDLLASATPPASAVHVPALAGERVFKTQLAVLNDPDAAEASPVVGMTVEVAGPAALRDRLVFLRDGTTKCIKACVVPPLAPGKEVFWRIALERSLRAPPASSASASASAATGRPRRPARTTARRGPAS